MDSIYTQLPELEIGLRLIAASLLGGVIGLEREAKERPAGLRTHMLTSLAAAVFTDRTVADGNVAAATAAHDHVTRELEELRHAQAD